MNDKHEINVPLPILTPRLRLDAVRPEDGKTLNEAVMSNIESISQWMPWANPPPDLKSSEDYALLAAKEFAERKVLALLIWDRYTGELLGSSGFHDVRWDIPSFETGYWLRKEALGQGYILETVTALTHYAFQMLGAKRLAILCDKDNFKSKAIPEKLGFDLEAVLRNHELKVGGKGLRDTLIYSRIGTEGLPEIELSWGEN